MRPNSGEELRRSQRSVFWYLTETQDDPKVKQLPDYYRHFYTSILIDDVRHSVIPYPGSTKRQFSVKLSPPDDRTIELVVDGIDRENYRRDLPDAVRSFVEACAVTLLEFEEAFYEIAWFIDSSDKRVGFYLAFIPSGTVFLNGDMFEQYVPVSIAEQRQLKSQYQPLSSDTILIFKLPEYVRSQFGQMMEFLASQSQKIAPDFYFPNLRNRKDPVPFDYDEFHRTQKMALYEATKLIGYNFRDYNSEMLSEYYVWYRELEFERFKIRLRDSILMTLNQGLIRAGKELGFHSQIEINGLPSETDVEAAHERLASGVGTFNEIVSSFKHYT